MRKVTKKSPKGKPLIKIRARHTVDLGKRYGSKKNIVLKARDTFELDNEDEAIHLSKIGAIDIVDKSLKNDAETYNEILKEQNAFKIPEKNHLIVEP